MALLYHIVLPYQTHKPRLISTAIEMAWFYGAWYKAPFPWFGGKSKAAPLVWKLLGDPVHYVEPFFGSGAVLLQRPHPCNRPYYSETGCIYKQPLKKREPGVFRNLPLESAGWTKHEWFKDGYLTGGMGNVAKNGTHQQYRERLWASPNCRVEEKSETSAKQLALLASYDEDADTPSADN